MKLTLPKAIEVIDTTLRDGLQNEERFVPLEAKLYIAQKLVDAGFKRIEVGSLSHIKYVPQFKDIDALVMALPKAEDVEYTVLALNMKACERAVKLLAEGAPIGRVLTGQIATSASYARKNMNKTHDELFAEAEKTVKLLHDAGVKTVVGNIGTIFGCPIEGKVPLERAWEFMDRMFAIGFDEIEHSDPDGNATPKDILNYFDVVMDKYPNPQMHSLHIHDIRGTGMACYYAGMTAGVRVFDCSVGGIGGQVANFVDHVPVKGTGDYYFDTRRTGLVSSEDFVTMANGMGAATGVDEEKLYRLGRDMEKILDRQLYALTATIRHLGAGVAQA